MKGSDSQEQIAARVLAWCRVHMLGEDQMQYHNGATIPFKVLRKILGKHMYRHFDENSLGQHLPWMSRLVDRELFPDRHLKLYIYRVPFIQKRSDRRLLPNEYEVAMHMWHHGYMRLISRVVSSCIRLTRVLRAVQRNVYKRVALQLVLLMMLQELSPIKRCTDRNLASLRDRFPFGKPGPKNPNEWNQRDELIRYCWMFRSWIYNIDQRYATVPHEYLNLPN